MALPSSPVIHLRSEDVATDPVSAWPDQSGNGNDFAQSTSGQQPALVPNELNGFQVVRFDGTNDQLGRSSGGAVPQPMSMVVVCRNRSVATSDRATSSMGRDVLQNNLGPTVLLRDDAWQMYAGSFSSSGIAQDTDWHIVIGVFDNGSSALTVDDTTVGTTPNTRDGQNWRVGSAVDSSGNLTRFWDGDIAEFLFYDRALNSTEIDDTVAFFDAKYFGTPAVAVGQVTEVESALTITPVQVQVIQVGQASEVETGLTVTPLQPRTVQIGVASEAEAAQPISPITPDVVQVGQATEAENALTITPSRTLRLGTATEREIAAGFLIPRTVHLGTATEREIAQVITPTATVPGTLAPIVCDIAAPTVACSTAAPTVTCTIDA